jgi:outer membrane protein OmpA-like peptidoglycan-associated protein
MWYAMMKVGSTLPSLLLWLVVGRAMAQQDQKFGLKGEYYNGTNFEQKVLTRVDPQLDFNWRQSSPARGVNQSYYSVRWTGKLVAPASGRYTFNAKVDDGIRIWVGNRKVMDVWQLNDSKTFTGSIVLEGGHVYDLRIDYFNAMLEGEIKLYWVRPDAKKPLLGFFDEQGEPITSRYFRLPTPPGIALPKPVVTPSVAVSATPAKPVSRSLTSAPVRQPKPIVTGSLPQPVAASAPVAMSVPESKTVVTTAPYAKPAILQQVQFEQSSYVLLPQSFPELDKLVQTLRANPAWHIELIGHTDNVGDPRVNQTLSDYRARMVMRYLTQRGIADDRIETKGYGGSRPIAGNETEAGRAMNRRVELLVK